jgi:hypothetical protein
VPLLAGSLAAATASPAHDSALRLETKGGLDVGLDLLRRAGRRISLASTRICYCA